MQQKNELYYKDLIYQLRYYSKVEFLEDEVTKERIKERDNNKIDIVRFKILDKKIIAGNESEFAIDLFSIAATIKKV